MSKRRKLHGDSSANLAPEVAFGKVLRELRLARSLTQEELAHQSGYHANYIGYLERGIKSPSLRGIVNLAATLEIAPSLIMRRVERQLSTFTRSSHQTLRK